MTELLKALDQFQQEVPVIYKDTKAFNYKYADLPTILEIIKPLLKKNNLMFTQPLTMQEGIRGIRTILCHTKSGEVLEGFVPVADVKLAGQNDYQTLGSGITYLRRYSLESVLGLVTSKDTDATGGSGSTAPTKTKLSPRDTEKWAAAVGVAKKAKSTDPITSKRILLPADLDRLKKEAGLA